MATTLEPWLLEVLEKADELPSLPAVAFEVLRLCRVEETTLDDMAAVVARDPALSAKLLRYANSSLYGCGEEARTLRRAMLVLGLKSVQMMALSFSLVSAVPRQGDAGTFEYARYWQRSLVRAVSARALALRCAPLQQDEAFVAGLLSEIGQVVLARCLPEPYARVLQALEGNAWPSPALEREHLGFDSRDVGSALLRSWQLPGIFVHTTRHAVDPDGLPDDASPEVTQLVRVLALAERATELFTLGSGGPELAGMKAPAEAWFGIAEAELAEILLGLEEPLREAESLLELPSSSASKALLAAARKELLQLSLRQARELRSLRLAIDPAQRASVLAEPANLDALTGVASEAGLAVLLEYELRARIEGQLVRPLGFLLFELVRTPALADETAHVEAQRTLSDCLARLTRKYDVVARTGPGRFALLQADATPYGQRALAERVRQELLRVAPQLSLGIAGASLARVRRGEDGRLLREACARLLERALAPGSMGTEVRSTWLPELDLAPAGTRPQPGPPTALE